MTTLIVVDHDNSELKPSTLNVVTAAQKIGGDVVVLVAGQGSSCLLYTSDAADE